MSDYADLEKRLCNAGSSVLFGEAADAIATLTRERDEAGVGACEGCGSTETIEAIRERHPKALSCCPERKMLSAKEWMARAEKAEAERDALRALLREAGEFIEEHIGHIKNIYPERDDILARIAAETQTETGGK